MGFFFPYLSIKTKNKRKPDKNQTDCRADTTAKGFIWANISTSTTSVLQGQSYSQPCNQFGLFTRKVTSRTCISTRDPATKSIQNSLFVRRVVPCIQTSDKINCNERSMIYCSLTAVLRTSVLIKGTIKPYSFCTCT